MITREMIRNGFETGIISIEEEYGGCLGICCRIGDNAFYFIDSEDAELTKDEYWKKYTLDVTVDTIFNILKDAESAEEYGLDLIEVEFYTSILSSETEAKKFETKK